MLSQTSFTSEDWPGIVLDAISPTTTGTVSLLLLELVDQDRGRRPGKRTYSPSGDVPVGAAP